MSLFLRILFWVAAVGSVTSTIYLLMVVIAAVRFWLRRRRDDRVGEFLPPLSVLKPLHGKEPGLEKNLESFFTQDYPEFELLFCARHETDEGLRLAQAVGARHPQVQARYLTCGEPQYPNAKMYSLGVMAEAARNEHMVTSDADSRVERDLLRRVVQSLADPKLALASCLYLGTADVPNLATQLDAVGKSVEMGSGVLVADMVEGGTKFALGVVVVQRRKAFYDAGGYEDLGQYQAEDYVMGKRLAEQGQGVIMAPQVIRLVVPETSFAASFRNQLRWMQSTRRSRPAGHLGTGLTFSVPFGLLGLAWGVLTGRPELGALWLLGSCVNRWVQAGVMLKALGEPRWVWQALIYPLRDLLGWVIWFVSYLPAKVHYHGGQYLITPDGRYKQVP
ncbi:glycosyltransferase [Edaphobacter bradus]|uniref:glycosyltransferase n=1 Tax=Edaphobacter bradus TaxID=2259016 RepID=UPI0021DF7964|nr:glycosyltransferase [Edaphobacter bradus]